MSVSARGLCLMALLLCGVGVTLAQDRQVHYRDGRVSAQLTGVPLSEALDRLSRATGVTFSLKTEGDRVLSLSFVGLSLEQSIARMLSGYNYIMLHAPGPDGLRRPDRVFVLSRGLEEPMAVVAAPAPAPAPAGSLVIRRDGSGHYVHPGAINGQPVEFLVDTGASRVTLSTPLALRLGLPRLAQRPVRTANGTVLGHETLLQRVTLGQLSLDAVPALILPRMPDGAQVLLGMSFLSAFELVQRGDRLMLRRISETTQRPVD